MMTVGRMTMAICRRRIVSGFASGFGVRGHALPVQKTENGRDENERGDRGEQKATDHRAAQRGVLLAAIAKAERHRHHA